jgi:hypothetical protein
MNSVITGESVLLRRFQKRDGDITPAETVASRNLSNSKSKALLQSLSFFRIEFFRRPCVLCAC